MVVSPRGCLRVAKLTLIVTVIAVGAIVLRPVLDGDSTADGTALIVGAAYDVVALTAATTLAVFETRAGPPVEHSAGTSGPDSRRHDRPRRSTPMPVLDHTIVAARDHLEAAAFMTTILGLPDPVTLGPFALVSVGQTTTLDFVTVDGPVEPQHYAFSVTEAEFDEIFARIRDRGLGYWADPFRHEPDRINTWDGGRGVYFDDPNGHLLEIITRPYGSGGTTTDQPHPLVAATSAGRTTGAP